MCRPTPHPTLNKQHFPAVRLVHTPTKTKHFPNLQWKPRSSPKDKAVRLDGPVQTDVLCTPKPVPQNHSACPFTPKAKRFIVYVDDPFLTDSLDPSILLPDLEDLEEDKDDSSSSQTDM